MIVSKYFFFFFLVKIQTFLTLPCDVVLDCWDFSFLFFFLSYFDFLPAFSQLLVLNKVSIRKYIISSPVMTSVTGQELSENY